jgi:Leucine-rich repeat (LRR) protein/pimeloyl-ACP methyl ester carboxylesterase
MTMERTASTQLPRCRHLVITVHGIRTFGQWQERLENLLRTAAPPEAELTVVHYKFGYFSAFAFLSIFLRWLTTRRFRSELVALTRTPWDRVDIVAHSFGTFIATKALAALPASHPLRVSTLILAGSVLPDFFSWSKLVPARTQRVVNECGTKDNVLFLSQALPFLGMAGRVGFRGFTGTHLRNRFFHFGHSGYFIGDNGPTDEFMRNEWVPILIEGTEASPADCRTPSALAGIGAFLLNNSRPLKILAYSGFIASLIGWGWPSARSAYAAQIVSKERGYITRDARHRARVWFDENADPSTSIRWLAAVGSIDQIDLDSTKIHDSDVEALPRIEGLTALALGNTKITKRALSSLARFPNLKSLSLANDALNSLDGLPGFPMLERLDLENTGIHDADLASIARFRSLRQLDLSGNEIEGTNLHVLSTLTNLIDLDLGNNQALDDDTLRDLSVFTSLQKLSLSGSGLEGDGLKELVAFPKLWSLNLAFSDITDAGLAYLPVLPRLKELMLTGTNVTGKGFTSIGKQVSLEELWLKDTQVTNAALLELSPLKSLKILALPGTKIKPGALSNLRALSNLEELYLGGTEITDADLASLRDLPRLRVLYLPQNPQISDAGLLTLQSILTLQELNIERTGTSRNAKQAFKIARPRVKLVF